MLHINFDGLLHELGDGKTCKLLWKRFTVSNHSPWRNYYARRNMIYLARKYKSGREMYIEIITQIVYAVGTVLLEDKKLQRLKYNAKGVFEGLVMKTELKDR